MTPAAQLQRLARALGVTPRPTLPLPLERGKDGRWWLLGVEGDTALPMTRGCHTAREAIDAAEAWLMPEIGRLEDRDA